EGELDGDLHRDWRAHAGARLESPLLRGCDRLLIQTERRVERANDLNIRNRSIGPHDALQQNSALNLCAHGVAGVLRLHLANDPRQRDAVPWLIDAAACAAAKPWPEARTHARTHAAARTCARAAAAS